MRLLLLTVLLLLFGPSQLLAQSSELDRLRGAWERWQGSDHTRNDTVGTSLATGLALAYQDAGMPDSALLLSSHGIALAEAGLRAASKAGRLVWLNHRMTAERIKAGQLFFLNRYPECIEAIKAYLATAEELQRPEDIGAAYNYIGYCYTAMEDVPNALLWSNKALRILERNEGQDLANAYVGVAGLHFDLGQGDSALSCLRSALRLYERFDEPVNKAAALGMMAEAYLEIGAPDSVDHYLSLLRQVTDEHGGTRMRMRMRLYLLEGQVALQEGRVAQAMTMLERADSLASAMDDHRQRYFIGRHRAIGYALLGEVSRANELFDVAVDELKKDLDLVKVRALAGAQAKAEQEKELATSVANAEAYRKGRWFAWAVAGGGLTVALLLGILYRQGRRNAKLLAAAQDEMLRMEKQREAERVRMNVARDIHDELGGSLSKIALLSDLVQQGGAEAERADRLRAIADNARQVRGSLNDVVWAADPSSDHAGALLQHIADRTHRLLDGTGVELQLDLHADDPQQVLGPAFKRDLSMVVKEALNNALKHARPSLISVRFRIHADRFALTVSDNGRGMGRSVVDGGNGLANMRERLAAHGGSFLVRPAGTGTGTVVEAAGSLATV